jgi:hypothetical protein
MPSSSTLNDPDWAALLRNSEVVDLKAIRDLQEAHRAVFEFKGPPAIAELVRMFRMTGLFAFLQMQQKRFPVLNRAWADLQWILKNPAADEFSVASWAYFDLPVTEDGRTIVQVFGADIAPKHPGVQAFVDVARNSRYGIYVDDGGTGRTHRLVELVTRRRVTVLRGVHGDSGELYWTRIIEWRGQKFMLGDTRGWTSANRDFVTELVLKHVGEEPWSSLCSTLPEAYERFMKLSGPYWLSMLYSQNEDDPVLLPLHQLAYLDGPVPDLAQSSST